MTSCNEEFIEVALNYYVRAAENNSQSLPFTEHKLLEEKRKQQSPHQTRLYLEAVALEVLPMFQHELNHLMFLKDRL